jgi:hypothetical protein
MRNDILERKQEILQWISENQPKAYMCRELKCKPETLNSYLKKMNIDYEGNQSGKGFTKQKSKWTLEEYLQNSADIQTNKVRTKLLEEGIKEHRCECCGLTEWLGEPITLEVHHIDGDHYNNSMENL